VVYTQTGKTGTLYLDGQPVATGKAPIQPKDISTKTLYNWLGRAPFRGDVYLKNAQYRDFRIYDKGLTQKEIMKLIKGFK
jgi:hypothetical protein